MIGRMFIHKRAALEYLKRCPLGTPLRQEGKRWIVGGALPPKPNETRVKSAMGWTQITASPKDIQESKKKRKT